MEIRTRTSLQHLLFSPEKKRKIDRYLDQACEEQ